MSSRFEIILKPLGPHLFFSRDQFTCSHTFGEVDVIATEQEHFYPKLVYNIFSAISA